MARARKLFPIYGSSLANNILGSLARERIVAGFVAGYVAEHKRPGILGGPARDRELAETIGREIVLGLIAETRDALPRFFRKQSARKLKPEEQEAIEAFFRELLAVLERAQKWSVEDRRQFGRDLALYSDFNARRGQRSGSRKKGKAREEEAPFIARVALLLDPSMLEEAHRSARKFYGSVRVLARKLLRKTLG
jgi:hypothetical protein